MLRKLFGAVLISSTLMVGSAWAQCGNDTATGGDCVRVEQHKKPTHKVPGPTIQTLLNVFGIIIDLRLL